MPSYDVELSAQAYEVLQGLPPDVIVCVSQHLDKLADDPLALGRPARFPYRPVGQVYEFWCETPGPNYFITAFFHYLPGESVIRVFDLGFRQFS